VAENALAERSRRGHMPDTNYKKVWCFEEKTEN
jgi:hypothetical protein